MAPIWPLILLGFLSNTFVACEDDSRETELVCQVINHKNTINDIERDLSSFICIGATDVSEIFEQAKSVENLIIENSHLSGDPQNIMGHNIKTLTIRNSYVDSTALEWIYSLPQLKHLTIFKSWTHTIKDHNDRSVNAFEIKFTGMKSLKSLNISHCNITKLDVTKIENHDDLPHLILADNSFACGNDFLWLFNLHEKYAHKKLKKVQLNDTICFMEKLEENITFQALYTLRNKPFLAVMEYKKEVAFNCPSRCNCEFIGMHTVERPVLSVDCIGLNMTSLPNVIPKGSSRFNFTRNHITDLSPLYSNPLYLKVSFMDLSYNRISYLDPLKFSQVLKQQPRGVGFNLDHNLLTKFPAEVMLKVFQDLKYMPQFFLGFNPYICSCDYVGHFQQLIYYYLYDIKDARDIRCSEEDPDNAGKMVIAVDTSELCFREPFFHTLDLINVILACMLLILVADFVYNYRQYKKHRKLPWIVTKFKC